MNISTALTAIRNRWHETNLQILAEAFHHGGAKVTGILCMRCGIWVKPRHFDPTYDVCAVCLPAAKAEHRAWIRDMERQLALPNHNSQTWPIRMGEQS